MSNYATLNIKDTLSRIPGVGDIGSFVDLNDRGDVNRAGSLRLADRLQAEVESPLDRSAG